MGSGDPKRHHLHWRKEAQAAYAHQVPSGSRLSPFDNEEEEPAERYEIVKADFFVVGSGDPFGIGYFCEKKISLYYAHQVPSRSRF